MREREIAQLRHDVGVRDTRKIDALYNMTGADVREQARFEDSIGIFPEFIDGYGILILPTTGRYFHVPYRSLVPKVCRVCSSPGAALVATKCRMRSAQHDVLRRVRSGCGRRAAISVQTGQPFDRLDVSRVQAELLRQGARIH